MKETVHLVLISAQAVPNVTPILDERFRPERVIMLLSEDMAQRADALENVYRPRGVRVTRWPIGDAFDVEHIREQVLACLSSHEDAEVILNATGGTKPMSIAAYEVFRAFNRPIFYVHPEKDRLIWMHPGNQDSFDLADRIKLKEFLKTYGASHVEFYQGGVSRKLRELCNTLIGNIERFEQALSSLNYYAAQTGGPPFRSPDIGTDMNKNHNFWRLVELFEQANLLQKDGAGLLFEDEQARFIVNGGWLECYAYACCLNIKKPSVLQDAAKSVVVEKDTGRGRVKNELDVALLKDNRLHILECKTERMSAAKAARVKSDAVLYKLDSIRDNLGGLQARAMLVSARRLKTHHLNRARTLKIALCCHSDLKYLEEKLNDWIKN